jgi:hypothetical protein
MCFSDVYINLVAKNNCIVGQTYLLRPNELADHKYFVSVWN